MYRKVTEHFCLLLKVKTPKRKPLSQMFSLEFCWVQSWTGRGGRTAARPHSGLKVKSSKFADAVTNVAETSVGDYCVIHSSPGLFSSHRCHFRRWQLKRRLGLASPRFLAVSSSFLPFFPPSLTGSSLLVSCRLIPLTVPGTLAQLAGVRQRSVCAAEPSLANKGVAASNIFTHPSSALIHHPSRCERGHGTQTGGLKRGRRPSRRFATAHVAVLYLQGSCPCWDSSV